MPERAVSGCAHRRVAEERRCGRRSTGSIPGLTDIARLRPQLRRRVPSSLRRSSKGGSAPGCSTRSRGCSGPPLLVLVVDDLQWADADTLDWFQYFLRCGPAPLLLVGPCEQGRSRTTLRSARSVDELERLERLTGSRSARSTGGQGGWLVKWPGSARRPGAQALRETEGHPLFIVERGRIVSRARLLGAAIAAGAVGGRRPTRAALGGRAPPLRWGPPAVAISGSTLSPRPAIPRRTRSCARSTNCGAPRRPGSGG